MKFNDIKVKNNVTTSWKPVKDMFKTLLGHHFLPFLCPFLFIFLNKNEYFSSKHEYKACLNYEIQKLCVVVITVSKISSIN